MAKSLFLTLLKHYLFWLLLFAFGRTVFMLWNLEELHGISLGEILRSYIKALYVDTSMASYLLVLPFFILLTGSLTGKQIFLKINGYLHIILFPAFFLITFSELALYDEWHTKLNYKALWFFQNPTEVFHTATWTQLISCLGATAVCSTGAYWLFRKKINALSFPGKRNWMLAGLALIVPGVLFIGMRGGFQTIPIQLSDAYYSHHNILNLVSLNSAYNLASSCIENSRGGEPYAFLPQDEATKTFAGLFSESTDSTTFILTKQRPNIVLVVLEGWSADVLQSLNGIQEISIAPHMDSIVRDGFSFPNCYASGSLSDQGMAAVFSAFPAQPLTSIITQPNKYEKLPCINKKLKAEGYHTSFMFGGQLSYGNIRSYMYFNGFDKIIEGEDFPDDIPQGKLGAHDEFLFDRQLNELRNEQQPFFASMFTLSTHGPYDFPSNTDLNYGDKEEDYVNSIHYADSCIGEFIRRAKKERWYKNTLFVFISDHSHNSPMNYEFISPPYRRIPWIFYGEVIDSTYRGMQNQKTVSQTDLASTLLGQLGIAYSDFKYSKNAFNRSSNHFAYYSFEEGFGFVRDDAWITWSIDGRASFGCPAKPAEKDIRKADSLSALKNGQAILQTLSVDYWQY